MYNNNIYSKLYNKYLIHLVTITAPQIFIQFRTFLNIIKELIELKPM